MTAGNNGASTPEDDDPFGYLYEDGQASTDPRGQNGYGYPGPAAQPGVPRTSYNQVRSVGERQYGQQQSQPQQPPYSGQQSPYGQAPNAQNGQQPHGQTAAYGRQPDPQSGQPTRLVPAQRGGARGSGPNTKGLLIGAVAVVALVVIGISIAIASSGDDKNPNDAKPSTSPVSQSAQPSKSPTDSGPETPAPPSEQDAATLQLTPPAVTANQVPGAKSAGGTYVSLAGGQGAAVTWTVSVPQGGAYTLSVDYGVPGKDAKTSLTVNGQPHSGGLNMKNFAQAAPGDWAKGWTNTYAFVNLQNGQNAITISCGAGDQCDVNLDQLSLEAGQNNG